MAKRRLSKQQLGRIAKNQEADSIVNGVIIRHFGKQLDVEVLAGTGADEAAEKTGEATLVRCHQRANLPTLVTGDRVTWEPGEDGVGVIPALAERRSVFARPGFAGVVKPMASNIDVVLVVIAPTPMPHANLIDRYLVAIEALNLQPLLILNKCDLLSSCEEPEAVVELVELYRSLSYPCLAVSALQGEGLEALREQLQGRTTVLVGQSGVGKSSLVNGLGGDLEDDSPLAQVGELSEFHDKGMHTTTTSVLFHLDGFDLIDSPGIREFGLGHVSPQEVLEGFVELREIARQCKFRDCAHQGEPGCAVDAALEAGEIHPSRLNSYFQIIDSLE